MLLLRLGHKDEAFHLAESLRDSWTPERQQLVTGAEFLESRWITASGTKLPPDIAGIDKVDWTHLESCRYSRSGEIPFLLRALGGDQVDVASRAMEILFDHIEHQGDTYEVTPYVVRALISLLDAECIGLPGLANWVRVALSRRGIFRHVPKARRDWISLKKNPLDGLVLGAHGAFKTFRNGIAEGPCLEIPFGKDRGNGSYSRGKRAGEWTFFYRSGGKEAEGAFEGGRKHGLWLEWHENGARKSEGAWILDKRDGRWWAGTAKGDRFSVGTYKNDKRHGQWEDTWEDGTTKTTEWKNGVQVK